HRLLGHCPFAAYPARTKSCAAARKDGNPEPDSTIGMKRTPPQLPTVARILSQGKGSGPKAFGLSVAPVGVPPTESDCRIAHPLVNRFRALLMPGASALLCALASAAASAASADWPQWRGPDRPDVSKESGLLKTW